MKHPRRRLLFELFVLPFLRLLARQTAAAEPSSAVNQREVSMPDTIQMGSILIKGDAIFPEALQFESRPCVDGWRFVNSPGGRGFGQRILAAGGTFFYMAGQVHATAFGLSARKALHRALARILTKLKSGECNSWEITRVASKRFLGLPYSTISGHSRHIQEGLFLFRSPAQSECAPQLKMAA